MINNKVDDMSSRMKYALYVFAVLVLTYLFLPIISFAEEKVNQEESAEVAVEAKEVESEDSQQEATEEQVDGDAVVKEAVVKKFVINQPEKLAVIKVSDIWARPTLQGRDIGVVYLTVENNSDKLVSLISATASSVADRVEIHTTINKAGVMSMRKLARLDVFANSKQVLSPGGLHLMLFDLKKQLAGGDKFNLNLKFSDGSSKLLEVPVVNMREHQHSIKQQNP